MSIYGPSLKKSGRLKVTDRRADKITGLLLRGAAVPGKLVLGSVYKLNSIRDAEDTLGIDAAYDAANAVLVWYHLSEFYLRAGEGTEVWLMVVPQTALLADLADEARTLVHESNGAVRRLAVGGIPHSGYSPVLADGMEAATADAIPVFQELAVEMYGLKRPFNVILEGRNMNGAASAWADLRDPLGPAGGANKVTLVIAQDPDIAALNAAYAKHAAIGTLAGMAARRRVHESVGYVLDGDISDPGRGRWLKAAFSDGTSVASKFADWPLIDDKGYVFARNFPGRDGVFFNDGHTCAPMDDPESTIQYGQVLDKASRVLYSRLLDFFQAPVALTEAGLIPEGARTEMQEILAAELDLQMTSQGEISARKVTVDPSSDLVNPPRELKVLFEIVPAGTITAISGTVLLTASL
jgi:hypothetical protein